MVDIRELARLSGVSPATVSRALNDRAEVSPETRRRILEINPRANVEAYACRWQDRPKALNGSTLVMGCVDSFSERQQIEACCRTEDVEAS